MADTGDRSLKCLAEKPLPPRPVRWKTLDNNDNQCSMKENL